VPPRDTGLPGSPPLTPNVDHMWTDGHRRRVDSIRHHGAREIPPGGAGGEREGDRRDRRVESFTAV